MSPDWLLLNRLVRMAAGLARGQGIAPPAPEEATHYAVRSLLASIRKMSAGQSGEVVGTLVSEARFAAFYAEVAGKAHSQLGQDAFALMLKPGQTPGYFVEVGASNGRDHSNSLMLERDFGWSGLLVDQSQSGASFARTIRNSPFAVCRITNAPSGPDEARLQSVLDTHDAPKVIDYLSIDTDGSELDVLASLDLGARQITTLTVPHNFSDERLAAYDELLAPHGYVRVLVSSSDADAYYVLGSAWRRFTLSGGASARPQQIKAEAVREMARPDPSRPIPAQGTAFYLAGGIGSRWGDFGGGPKQIYRFAPDAQPVITRLLDQFTTALPGWRHVLMTGQPRVADAAAAFAPEVVEPLPGDLNCDKFLSSRHLWPKNGPMLFIYGDCFLGQGVAHMIGSAGPETITFYGSKTFAELFAIYVPEGQADRFEQACRDVRAGEVDGSNRGGGWRILRYLSGLAPEPSDEDVTGPLGQPYYVDLHDGLSRDFDYPADAQIWSGKLALRKLTDLGET